MCCLSESKAPYHVPEKIGGWNVNKKLSASERVALYERIGRNAKMATTYLRKATEWGLYATRSILEIDPLTDYWALLDAALEGALDIVEALPDEFFADEESGNFFGLGYGRYNLSDEPLERAEKIVAALQKRRDRLNVLGKIERLENGHGRGEQEAALFRAKAAELREKHGLQRQEVSDSVSNV